MLSPTREGGLARLFGEKMFFVDLSFGEVFLHEKQRQGSSEARFLCRHINKLKENRGMKEEEYELDKVRHDAAANITLTVMDGN